MQYRLAIVTALFTTFLIIGCNNSNQEQGASESSVNAPLESLSDQEKQYYTEQGKKIAKTSFKTLSGQLQKAMAEGGISNAVKYCNVEAYPLTDSLKQQFGVVELRRATDKPRNEKNLITESEKAQLDAWKKQKLQGKDLKPEVHAQGQDQVVFYAPIVLKGQCLTCHGNKEAMGADYADIQKLYPNDKATGYELGDLRGMWSITFKKESDV
jgi:hypothetical protein